LARKARPSPKLCERCESFFPSIASGTCPQCFAPLLTLTEEEAARAAEFQIERLKDPEYLEEKCVEDERFKEQSFGACLGVVAVLIAVVVISGVFVTIAAHEKHKQSARQHLGAQAIPDSNGILPQSLGDLNCEQIGSISQAGMSQPILHAKYGDNILVYALPAADITAVGLAEFRLAVSAVDNQTAPPLISQEVRGKRADYAIIGSNGGLVGDVAQRFVNSEL
jgi:hypothetical protein